MQGTLRVKCDEKILQMTRAFSMTIRLCYVVFIASMIIIKI